LSFQLVTAAALQPEKLGKCILEVKTSKFFVKPEKNSDTTYTLY